MTLCKEQADFHDEGIAPLTLFPSVMACDEDSQGPLSGLLAPALRAPSRTHGLDARDPFASSCRAPLLAGKQPGLAAGRGVRRAL